MTRVGDDLVTDQSTSDVAPDLGDLTRLLSGAVGLDVILHNVAEYTVSVLRSSEGAVARMSAGRSGRAAAAGSALAEAADEVQYVVGEGPTLDAATTGTAVCCGSIGGDERWPRFGSRAGRLGMHSVLAVPLILADDVVATVTAYSRDKLAFDRGAVGLSHRYAGIGAAVLHNAYALEHSRERIEQLTEALTVRPVIDQAVGIVMSRSGKSEEDALATLRRMSNADRVRLTELSRTLVIDARRKANRRRRLARPD
jgi:GAF domain-containing protein